MSVLGRVCLTVAFAGALAIAGCHRDAAAPRDGGADRVATEVAPEVAQDVGHEAAPEPAPETAPEPAAEPPPEPARDAASEAPPSDAVAETVPDVAVEAPPADARPEAARDGGTGDGAVSVPPAPSCTLSLVWQGQFGDSGSQSGRSVAFTPDGGVVVAGEYTGAIDLGGGPLPASTAGALFVARFDAAGHHQWSKSVPAHAPYWGKILAVDRQGAVYLTGSVVGAPDLGGGPLPTDSTQRPFLLKLDAAGAFVYGKSFGGTGVSSTGSGDRLAVDADDNVVLTGELVATSIDLGGGPLPVGGSFVLKLDARGNHVFSKGLGNPSTVVEARGVAVDPAGNVVAAYSMRGLYGADFGGGLLPGASYNGDVVIAKWSPTGAPVWSKVFGDADAQAPFDLATDGSGRIFVTGTFEGGISFGGRALVSAGASDIFLTALDSDGRPIASRRFGDAGTQQSAQLTVDADGNVSLTGALVSSADFGGGPLTALGYSDLFVARFDASLRPLCSRRWGDTASQAGNGIAAGGGAIAFTGANAGTIDLSDIGGAPLAASAGHGGAFIAVVTPAAPPGADAGADGPPDASPGDAGGASPCGAGTLRWAARGDYAISMNSQIRAMDMDMYADGDLIVGGTLEGQAIFGHAPNPTTTVQGSSVDGIFVARYTEDGNARWARVWNPYGRGALASVFGVAAMGDGGAAVAALYGGHITLDDGLPSAVALDAVGGEYALQPFLVRIAADGHVLWAHNFATEIDRVAAAPDGGLTVAGRFGAVTVFGAGEPNETQLTPVGSDAFVARLDEGGKLRWVRGAGGPMNGDQPNGLVPLPDGGAAVTGQVSLPAVFARSAAAGDTITLPGTGERTYFLARYAADGTLAWVRGADADSVGQRVALAPDGALVTTGSLVPAASINAGLADATSLGGPAGGSTFLARHGADGALLSLARVGTLWGPYALAVRDDGAVLVGGQLYYPAGIDVGTGTDRSIASLGWEDGYALCMAPTGPVGWLHIASSDQHDNVIGIRVRPDGDAIVMGTFTASVGIDRGDDTQAVAIPHLGNYDFFLARVGR